MNAPILTIHKKAIRKAYPGEEWDWFHLTGFIHDLGKLLLLPRFGEPQWAAVGDTFPVGCRFHGNLFYCFLFLFFMLFLLIITYSFILLFI